jgi:hypothetical protein
MGGTPSSSVSSAPFSSPAAPTGYNGPRVSGLLSTRWTDSGTAWLDASVFASVSPNLPAGSQFYLTGIAPFGTFNPRITYTVQSYIDDAGSTNGTKIMNYLPNDRPSKIPDSRALNYTTGPYQPRLGALSTDTYGGFTVHYVSPGVIRIANQFERDFLNQNLPVGSIFTMSSISPPPAAGFNYNTVYTVTSVNPNNNMTMTYTPQVALPDNSVVSYVKYLQAPP